MVNTVGDFVNLVQSMREAQRKYFRTRDPVDLSASKAWEKQVDDAIKDYNQRQAEKKQPGLGI